MTQETVSRREFLRYAFLGFLGLGAKPLFRFLPEQPLREERVKTREELNVERTINDTYRLFLGERTIQGKKLPIRVPFGEMNERYSGQSFVMAGKGNPKLLWENIDRLLTDADFLDYQNALSQPGKKLVLFDLPNRSFQVATDEDEINNLKSAFRNNLAHPYAVKEDGQLNETDVYNYLYSQGVGLDCSGFAFNVQRMIAQRYGIDLCQEIGNDLGIDPEDVPPQIGTDYYNDQKYAEVVDDRICNLRPGDIILFPSRKRDASHSAVILSINFRSGKITYVQNTDWVKDRNLRGPHYSEILFDTTNLDKTLYDSSSVWTHEFGAAFESEDCPWAGKTDGFRYRLDQDGGLYRGKIVRLKKIKELILKKEKQYYTNLINSRSN